MIGLGADDVNELLLAFQRKGWQPFPSLAEPGSSMLSQTPIGSGYDVAVGRQDLTAAASSSNAFRTVK
jgi:hypothetical protein